MDSLNSIHTLTFRLLELQLTVTQTATVQSMFTFCFTMKITLSTSSGLKFAFVSVFPHSDGFKEGQPQENLYSGQIALNGYFHGVFWS